MVKGNVKVRGRTGVKKKMQLRRAAIVFWMSAVASRFGLLLSLAVNLSDPSCF